VGIDKEKIKTLDETDEPPPIDQVEGRVEAEMKRIEGKAREDVGSSLNNKELAREGQRIKKEAEGELKQLREEDAKP